MPYAPTVNDMSGQILAQGIGGFASGISQYLQKQQEKKKKESAIDMLSTYGASLGLPPELLKDRKALSAGVDSMGVDGVLALGQYAAQLGIGKAKAQAEAQKTEFEQALELAKLGDAQARTALEAQRVKLAEESATIENALKGAQTDKAKAETDKTKAETEALAKEETQAPLGEAKDIEGLTGWKSVRTGKNSLQLVPPQGMSPQQQIAAMSRAIPEKEFADYMAQTRNQDGTWKAHSWYRSDKDLNPLFEAYANSLGMQSFTADDSGKIVPRTAADGPAPAAPAAPAVNPTTPFPDPLANL